MKALKVMLMIFVCLGLANCKVKFNGEADVITIDGEEKGYVGNVDEIHYFDGGWYGEPGKPNYSMDLLLTVTKRGKINAILDTPTCKVTGLLGTNIYSKLANLIENSRKERYSSGMADGGVETVSLLIEDQEKLYQLSKGDMIGRDTLLIVERDSEKIKKLISRIAEKLEDRYGCDDLSVNSKIKVLHLEQNIRNISYPISIEENVSEKYLASSDYKSTTVKRDFKFINENGVLKVSGKEIVTGSSVYCFRDVENKVLDINLIEEIEIIEIIYPQAVCALAPLGDSFTRFSLIYSNGKSEAGYTGCWNSPQATKTVQFMNKFMKWLDRQPQKCVQALHSEETQ